MFPNQDHGRFSVSEDGTLSIEPVQKEDAGEYICKGLSVSGSAYAKARLEVKGKDVVMLNSYKTDFIYVSIHEVQSQVCMINWANMIVDCKLYIYIYKIVRYVPYFVINHRL